MSVRTLAKPLMDGPQFVVPPESASVLQTPTSVASKTCALSVGLNNAQRIGISGKFPSTEVHVVPPFLVSHTLFTP